MSSSVSPPAAGEPLGLYLHAPFCVSHCTYCDFYTRAYPGEGPVRDFARALGAEIRITARALGLLGRPVDTLYVGGGTPSLLDPPDLRRLLEILADTFRIAGDAEISMEANPESVGEAKLAALLEIGVNRLSLGVQSFEPSLLAILGRAHGADQARDAFAAARKTGFRNLSLDLMLALPGQTVEGVARDLEVVRELAPDHLSTYLLEMDKESALRSRIEKGELAAPAEEEAAGMYERVREVMIAAGYRHYEISNFARPGRECRHNLKYWSDRPFVGFGPSAWSYLDGRRFRVARDLEGYRAAVDRGAPPPWEEEVRTPAERMQEALFAGLRRTEGVDLEEVGRRYGLDPLESRREAIEELREGGLVERDGPRLRLTPRGYPIANEVFRVFV